MRASPAARNATSTAMRALPLLSATSSSSARRVSKIQGREQLFRHVDEQTGVGALLAGGAVSIEQPATPPYGDKRELLVGRGRGHRGARRYRR